MAPICPNGPSLCLRARPLGKAACSVPPSACDAQRRQKQSSGLPVFLGQLSSSCYDIPWHWCLCFVHRLVHLVSMKPAVVIGQLCPIVHDSPHFQIIIDYPLSWNICLEYRIAPFSNCCSVPTRVVRTIWLDYTCGNLGKSNPLIPFDYCFLDVAIHLLDLEVAMKSAHVNGKDNQVALCNWLMLAPPRPSNLQIHRQKQKCGRGWATDACHMFDCVTLSISLKSQSWRISKTLETCCACFVLRISHAQATSVFVHFLHS